MNKSYEYYVIHCNDDKRYNNILAMESLLSHKINIFNGVNGSDFNINNLNQIDPNLKLNINFRLKGMLGCYLSHFNLIKSMLYSNNDYTIIFEDDFCIKIPDLDNKIKNILNTVDIDFDFIFLGTQSKLIGDLYKDNIFYIDIIFYNIKNIMPCNR